MSKNLFEKVWEKHKVSELSDGSTQLFIGTHLIHEVTSPQAFGMLEERGLKVKYPHRTFATVDHIVPTNETKEPYSDPLAQKMIEALRKNTQYQGITFFDTSSGKQGIVHVVGPEQGITQPGMTIACGDSHTSTHGAFGAIAFGIGTSQVRDVLATQTMKMNLLKVRRININGSLGAGVTAKDVILHILKELGVNGGTGYAYEYGGKVIDNFSMEERMTICNMSIEGGARCGYVNPDAKTFAYLKDRPYAPKGVQWDTALVEWKSLVSAEDAHYDDVINFEGADIKPTITWGINPGQGIPVDEPIPTIKSLPVELQSSAREALEYMGFSEGQSLKGTPVDVVFIGSCTNGRLSDLKEAAREIRGRKVSPHVTALCVPGSQIVAGEAEKLGLDRIFTEAGFQWRQAGCSMCLAMNPDKLVGRQLCASTSNRNFKGRQGSPTGRTILMSPLMAVAAAVTGKICDARELFKDEG
ncbi:MAG: 3-isopropylmalate dehydratase large subunit [Spirochaetaceae bacterium]|nr:3-isopropylmalate dehydratase large subunit [Spirochaetaceae bacterium]